MTRNAIVDRRHQVSGSMAAGKLLRERRVRAAIHALCRGLVAQLREGLRRTPLA